MAQQMQFGPRYLEDQGQELEHYRIEIRKLKQINIQQQQGYQKKIEALQKMNYQQVSPNRDKNYAPFYEPGTVISNEILKRDKEINKLSQENDRLRKQMFSNPDRELIIKKRGLFDQVADKDAQIMRLKKTIYELQSKYDGKYFNDTRMRNEYDILERQNDKLKREMQANYSVNMNKKGNVVVGNEVLDGIKYKKQSQLISRENEYLRNQLQQVNGQYSKFRQSQNMKIGSSTEIQQIRKDLDDSNRKNRELIQRVKVLEDENRMIRNSNVVPLPIVDDNRSLENSRRSRQPIFKYENRNKGDFSSLGSPSRQSQQSFSHKSQKLTDQQIKNLNQLQQGEMSDDDDFNGPRPTSIGLVPPQVSIKDIESPRPNWNNNLPQTEKKKGGYYDRFNIAEVVRNTNTQKK